MNTPRRATIAMAMSLLGLLAVPVTASAATGPDPVLSSSSTEHTAIWVDPVLLRAAYCTVNRRDLMLPGQAGFEHCMQHGY